VIACLYAGLDGVSARPTVRDYGPWRAARPRDQGRAEAYYEPGINHGRLYPNLDTLVEKGLIEKGERDRRTNFYRTTRRGGARSRADASGKLATSVRSEIERAGDDTSEP
jgi:DNA-binding PadR family transcriptional regulator